jgi:protein-disulfide isomerase
MKRSLPFLIIGAVLLLAIGVVWKMLRANQPTAEPASLPTASTPAPAKEKPSAGHVVTMEEYGDYQCSPCGLIYPELKKIEEEYGGKLQIVFHHFPLTKLHKNALVAAHAAEAAARQNHFWEMHDRLYLNQKAWAEAADARSVFVGYARDLGLDVERFSRDMDSPEVDEKVTGDFRQGEAHGITGTPTLLLDGNQLRPEATTPQGIRRAIDYLLARKASSPPSG